MSLNPLFLFFAITTFAVSSNASAKDLHHANESSLQISRYVNLLPGPTKAQRNPLHMVLPNVSFRHEVKTVGQAIRLLLKDTGYRLTRHHPDKRIFHMFRLSLPKIHRRMGPLTLEQALKTLSGEPWILTVDPINRLVSFQLPDHFRVPLHVKTKPIKKKVNKPRKAVWNKNKIEQLQAQYQQTLKSITRANKPKVSR